MDDVVPVRVVEGTGNSGGKVHSLGDGQLSFPIEAVAERFPFDVWGDVVEEIVRASRVEEREDVRMGEVRGDLNLTEKSLGTQAGGELGRKDLQRDREVVLKIGRQVA